MLVENQVFTIKVNKKNIGWYQSKGHECNLKDEIIVKAEDLISGCHVRVKYICDGCTEEKDIGYCDYISRKSEKTYCKDCASKYKQTNDYYVAKDGYKICNECERNLLANTDYFYSKHDTKDGFKSKCKECSGASFTNKLTHIPKEGYKFCIKCDRELLVNIKYFPPDKLCCDGFRNLCRECGKDGHFMKDDYIPTIHWTDEENELFIERYSHYTCEELKDIFYHNLMVKQIWDHAYCLRKIYNFDLYKTKDVQLRANNQRSEKVSGENSPMYGKPKSEETKRKFRISISRYYEDNDGWWLGKKRSDEQRKMLSLRMKGKWSGNKNPRFSSPLVGKDNPNWRGGVTALYFELRSEIKEWQQESMKNCNYKCVISGKEFDNIHHLYPFKNIVNEVFETLNLEQLPKVLYYSEVEFDNIKDKLHELHNNCGLGVCLSKPIHKLFHDTYGYTNNTPEQFYEFELRYKLGEFTDIIKIS